MRRDEVSTSFRIHLSAVLQQFCSLLTAVSLFSLLASHIYWRTWLSLSLQMHWHVSRPARRWKEGLNRKPRGCLPLPCAQPRHEHQSSGGKLGPSTADRKCIGERNLFGSIHSTTCPGHRYVMLSSKTLKRSRPQRTAGSSYLKWHELQFLTGHKVADDSLLFNKLAFYHTAF